MREIKFRGKGVGDGKLVYGFYFGITIFEDYPKNTIPKREAHFIIPFGIDMSKNKTLGEIQVEVLPETVGQFTGLKDKNGKEIYEGDVVLLGFGCPEEDKEKCEVVFQRGCFCIIASWLVNSKDPGIDPVIELNAYCNVMCNIGVELIGNIHDNPELLKGEEK